MPKVIEPVEVTVKIDPDQIERLEEAAMRAGAAFRLLKDSAIEAQDALVQLKTIASTIPWPEPKRPWWRRWR